MPLILRYRVFDYRVKILLTPTGNEANAILLSARQQKIYATEVAKVLNRFVHKHNSLWRSRIYYLLFLFACQPLQYAFYSLKDYSQHPLSRLRLSRITAYLEKKIWSLF